MKYNIVDSSYFLDDKEVFNIDSIVIKGRKDQFTREVSTYS
jgi:hypothetical protein